MSRQNSFMRNSFLTITRQVLSIIIGLLSMIIIARYLGPEGQGSYSLIILIPTMLYTFLNIGIEVSTVYYVGKKTVSLNDGYKTNLFLSLALSFIGIIAGLIVIFGFSEKFAGIDQTLLLLILIVLPLYMLKQFLQSIFQAKQDFTAFNSVLILGQGSILIFVTIFLVLFDLGLGFALLSYGLGQLVALITVLYLLKKKYGLWINKGKFSKQHYKNSIKYGLKSHLSNIMSFLNYRLDILLIGFFLNATSVGFYTIAVSIAEKLWILSKSISAVLFPRIASSNDEDDKNNITSMVSRMVFAISAVGGVVLFFISGFLIELLFGNEYGASIEPFKILLPGIVLGSMARLISNDIAGRGKPEINMYTSICMVITNVILNILLIPKYGIEGAAYATTVTYTVNWIIKVIIFKRLTGLKLNSFILVNQKDLQLIGKIVRKYTGRVREGN
ncbi:flippase [Virgibacillus kekensis]|uniref:Flippase n=1 Tax=Virgibacillus kekensis TaxID=202261 RepID=A0ABV9DGP7_9BACI